MGLSASIGGGIVIFTIIYVVMTFPSLIEATSSITNTYSLKSDLENSILKSNIKIVSVIGVSLSNLLDVDLDNTGNEKLWDYDGFTVVVSYDGGILSKIKYGEQLSYDKNCSGITGTWCISQFLYDLQDPKILNPNERLHIKAYLAHPVYPNGLVTTSISTDNGVTSTHSDVIS